MGRISLGAGPPHALASKVSFDKGHDLFSLLGYLASTPGRFLLGLSEWWLRVFDPFQSIFYTSFSNQWMVRSSLFRHQWWHSSTLLINNQIWIKACLVWNRRFQNGCKSYSFSPINAIHLLLQALVIVVQRSGSQTLALSLDIWITSDCINR